MDGLLLDSGRPLSYLLLLGGVTWLKQQRQPKKNTVEDDNRNMDERLINKLHFPDVNYYVPPDFTRSSRSTKDIDWKCG